MDHERFDLLAKQVATMADRRRVLTGLGGAVLGLRGGSRDNVVGAQTQGPCEPGNTFLCHKQTAGPPNNAQCIEDSAVPAHIGHGDCFCGAPDCRCPTPRPGTECFLVGQAGPPPGSVLGPRGFFCPRGYNGLAKSPCNGKCPCKRRRRCKNGRCCEDKGTHCDANKDCCSGKCKQVHDNHKQCA